MQFHHRLPLGTVPGEAWALVRQVELVVACIPGVEDVERTPEAGYRAQVRDRVGPFQVRFPLDLAVTWDELRYDVVANGQDPATKSYIAMDVRVQVLPEGEASVLDIEASLQVTGRLGTLGQSVMTRMFEQKINAFAENLRRQFDQLGAAARSKPDASPF